ncbi:MAG: hypothetical protein PUF48_05890 [Oscillospiraceae bacterium]|nr:hypothetical protein [Oscillospiraceae bacterium]
MLTAEIMENGQIVVSGNTVSDSVKHEKIRFMFPDSWKNYQKTAVFGFEDTKVSVVLSPENSLCTGENECYIPFEVINSPGFTVSVFGSQGDSLATSARGEVRVIKSGYEEGDTPLEPTPSEYQQITEIVSEAKQTAQSLRNDADNGLFKGEKGDKGEKGEKGDSGELTKIDANTFYSNTLVGKVSGKVVTFEDVSPLQHKLRIKLSNKNLFDKSAEWTLGGTWLTELMPMISIYVGEGTTVTFSSTKQYKLGELGGGVIYALPVKDLNALDKLQQIQQELAPYLYSDNSTMPIKQSITLTSEDGYVSLLSTDKTVWKAFSENLQVELGEVATDYVAYGDFSGVSLKKYGKNLFDKTISISNPNFVSVGSGYRACSIYVGKGTTVTVSLFEKHETGSGLGYFYVTNGKKGAGKGFWLYHDTTEALCNKSATFESSDGYISLVFTGNVEAFENLAKELQVEIGSVATEYEEYRKPIISPVNCDGEVDVVIDNQNFITLIAGVPDINLSCEYNKDINKIIEKIYKSLGI